MKKIILHIFLLFACRGISQTTELILNSKWEFRQKGTEKWYPASVPGTVHTDLLNNQLIPDPFFGDNEKKIQWIENEDWEYHTQFLCDEHTFEQNNIELKFDGLDTYAKVYLNDQLILEADNMFRSWTVNVKKEIIKGSNSLRIVFASAVQKGKAETEKLSYTLPGDEKVFTRKAQYQYGWDWGPRLVTCGIWKPVRIITWNKLKIESIYACTKEIKDSVARIELILETKCETEGHYDIRYRYTSRKGEQNQPGNKLVMLRPGTTTTTLNIEVRNPQLWWCNGLNDGRSALYVAGLKILKNDSLIEQKGVTFGIRTLELIQDKDSAGSSFYFKLNGKPVFIKGANYIPPDNFLTRKRNHRDLLQKVKDANMNMLRIWGGGAYATKEFYDDCDKAGILIWQDLMFACAMYPGDMQFLDNVKKEVVEQVKELRNHPCLALWCGNNENDEGWHNWGWQKQYKYSENDSANIWLDYKRLFHVVIPNIIKQYDLKTPYWPSSPSIGWGHKESLQQGDSHYWGVWWGLEPFEVYTKKVGRFMSEYGFQSMPSLSTFKRFCNASDLDLNSEAVKNHQKHAIGYQTILKYMERDFIVPKDFSQFIYTSQLLQAKGMRTAIEAHRIAKPYCMGTLFWQLNDCWPVTSWSCLDYYNKPKAFYYALTDLYDDILISVQKQNENLNVYIVNDKFEDLSGKLTVMLKDFNGKELYSKKLDVVLKSNSFSVYFNLSRKDLSKFDSTSVYMSCEFAGKYSANTLFYFTSEKNLKLSIPKLSVSVDPASGALKLKSNCLVKNLFAEYNDFDFYPNYFDLEPNKEVMIKSTATGTNTGKVKFTSLNTINR